MAEYKLKTESDIRKKEDKEQAKLVIRQAAYRVENFVIARLEKMYSDAEKRGQNLRLNLTREEAMDLFAEVAPKALEAGKSEDV